MIHDPATRRSVAVKAAFIFAQTSPTSSAIKITATMSWRRSGALRSMVSNLINLVSPLLLVPKLCLGTRGALWAPEAPLPVVQYFIHVATEFCDRVIGSVAFQSPQGRKKIDSQLGIHVITRTRRRSISSTKSRLPQRRVRRTPRAEWAALAKEHARTVGPRTRWRLRIRRATGWR